MRILMLVPAAVMLMATSSAHASFDGTYSGAIQPNPEMASQACVSAPVTASVVQGRLSAKTPSLNGFVNIKGYVTGKVRMSDGRILPFEGRADDSEGSGLHIVAGIVDDVTRCDWTMDLARQ